MKLLPTLNKQTALHPLRNVRWSLMATCSLIVAFPLTELSAGTHTWQRVNENWGANDNWETAATHAGDNVVVNNTSITTTNNTNHQSVICITFGNNAGAFNLSGNALTLGSTIGLVNNNTDNIQTVSLAMTLAGATPFTTVTDGQPVMAGALRGAGGLSISCGGTLSLKGPDRHSGATNLAVDTGADNSGSTLGGDGAITGIVTISSGAIRDVGHGATMDRNLFIDGSVTSSDTMRCRVGGEAAATRDVLTLGKVDLVNTRLDFTFTDALVTEMTDATQVNLFLSNPTTYFTSLVYQIISGTTTNSINNSVAMDTSLVTILGVIWPDIP